MNFGERVEPRGWINVAAPAMFGRLHVLPLLRSFLEDYPQVDVRLLLLDRVVSLVDEGLDLGVRIGQLPDSTLRAVRVGQVRRVVCATPQYIARRGVPATPRDLRNHSVVSCTAVTPVPDRWSFHHPSGVTSVTVTPRLVVNTTAAAIDAALEDLGLTCISRMRKKSVYWSQIWDKIRGAWRDVGDVRCAVGMSAARCCSVM